MREFGELKRVDLRELWPNEAADFTPWLAENIDRLGNALGIELEMLDQEAAVGDFSLDLLAKDLGSGRKVIIENQITPTDHDHLGKLLTYASGFDAGVVIWIAKEIREEHRQALEWLNQRTDSETAFFGVVVEAVRIDESRPAYNFRLIVFPNEWQKRKKREIGGRPSARGEAYREFFQSLIDELRETHRFTNVRVAQPMNWYAFSSGTRGISYSTSFARGDRVRAEIYIDLGDTEANKAIFESLHRQKALIESEFGEQLDWEPLDDRRASRIAVYRAGSIMAGSATLDEIRSWAVERLLRFREVFGDRLHQEVARVG